MKLFIVISSILLISLNIFDTYSTTIILQNGGIELNPLMNWLIGHFGVIPSLLTMKILFIALLIYTSIKAITKKNIIKREILAVISGYCILIVYYSYFMYYHNLQCLMLLQQ